MVSEVMMSTQPSVSRTFDALHGDTTLQRSHSALDFQSTVGACLRGEIVVRWRALGSRNREMSTRRLPLRV